MIIKLGKKAKIFFKAGSKMVNEFGLWLDATIEDHTSMIIPDEIRKIYQNKYFGEILIIKDSFNNNFYLPEDEIEKIEYLY